MKKELLIASALVGSLGLAGVAEAASATMSGHNRVGVVGKDADSSTNGSTNASSRQSTFSVSLSETTDGGIGISTGFDLSEEAQTLDQSGITLTFTSGAKLDLIEAGSAYASHLASVPSASGEQGVAGSTNMTAPSGLDYASSNDAVGFELHTAADAFGIDGFKAGISASFNGDKASSTSAHTLENSFSVGASYVTTAGDSTVTIGGGFHQADTVATAASSDTQSTAMSISAVTGDLTVGLGYASGDKLEGNTGSVDQEIKSASVTTAGASYVSGDMTFAVGYANGEGQDGTLGAAADGEADTYEQTAASVDYVVASGVTATIGYSDRERSNEATTDTNHSGTSWYIGANVSF
jgi:hypothetical protein